MKTIEELSYDTFYKMENYHQITIDCVSEAEDLFNVDTPENKEEQRELLTSLGVLSYDISICLEVFNPEFKIEITDLTDLISLIEIRISYVESLEFKK